MIVKFNYGKQKPLYERLHKEYIGYLEKLSDMKMSPKNLDKADRYRVIMNHLVDQMNRLPYTVVVTLEEGDYYDHEKQMVISSRQQSGHCPHHPMGCP